MKRSEFLSRLLVTTGLIVAVGMPLFFRAHTPLIHARMADNGGWSPEILKAEVGKPLHLRLTSDDVVHGFAVGKMQLDSVDVLPGKVTDVILAFDKPGTYTFYCTRWCGLNHWRMRGTIEVSGTSVDSQTVTVPLYVKLGINLDALHESPIVPDTRPSAMRGKQLAENLDISVLRDADFYRANSPYQAFQRLSSTNLTDAEKWSVVSYVWQLNTTPEAVADARRLYAQNCAACHGENGGGNGVFADELAQAGNASTKTMTGAQDMTMQQTADFTDPKRLLGASPALLQGKILRGGMGTGMPMWGSLFTEQQIWDLVAYLYSFQFDYPK